MFPVTLVFLVSFSLKWMRCPPKWREQVCVYREQSVLGLEVEVISLIGTLPPSLSFCHLSLLMMLFSAISPSPPYLFSSSLLFSPRLHHSLVICPFSFHTCFRQRAVLWSLQSTRGESRHRLRGERSRPDRLDKREKRWEKVSHWLRVVLITVSWRHTHTHMHTLLRLIGLTAFTLREQ